MSNLERLVMHLAKDFPTKKELERYLKESREASVELRVAARYLRARAIPIDKNRIRSLAEDLQEVIRRKTHGHTGPLGTVVLVPSAPYDIRTVDGGDRTVFIRMQAVDTSSKYWVVSGGTGKGGSGRAYVVVNLNANVKAEDYYKSAKTCRGLSNQIYTVLLHELTHAADIFTPGIGSKLTPQEAQLNPAYYNHPGEVRAYLQEILEEVEKSPTLKALPEVERVFGPSKSMQYILGDSRMWQEISPYLNEHNKQLIMKAVAKLVSDLQQAKH